MAAADWIAVFRESGWLNGDLLEPPARTMLQFQFRAGAPPIYLKGTDHSGKRGDGAKPLVSPESASILANSVLLIEAAGRRSFYHLDFLEQVVDWDEHGKG